MKRNYRQIPDRGTRYIMKALIIIAHGSRREQSNNEIVSMVDRIRLMVNSQYERITHSFLEICGPSLTEAVEDCIRKGARDITVYPLFLNSGNHVQRDIPEMIRELDAAWPDCRIRLLQHFGGSEDIASLIANHVSA